MCQRDRLVALPLLVGLEVVNEDNEVLTASLVVNLGRDSGALHHFCGIVSEFVLGVGGILLREDATRCRVLRFER